MSKKIQSKKTTPAKRPRESVFREAWDNMNQDMAKVMPGFLAKRLQGRKGKVWIVAALTLIELLVLGAVGMLVYDWFVS